MRKIQKESRSDLEVKMLEEAEEKLKASQVFTETGAAAFDKRLRSRSDPLLQKGDKVKKGKNYGRVTAVYTDYCVVRWSKDQTVTSEKISRLEKV